VNGNREACWWSSFPENELAARQVSGLGVIKAQVRAGTYYASRNVAYLVSTTAHTADGALAAQAEGHHQHCSHSVVAKFMVLPVLLLLVGFVQPGVAPGADVPPGSWGLAQLVLEDFAFFGDGCIFLDMVRQHTLPLPACSTLHHTR
jgi:hypothetical protein